VLGALGEPDAVPAASAAAIATPPRRRACWWERAPDEPPDAPARLPEGALAFPSRVCASRRRPRRRRS